MAYVGPRRSSHTKLRDSVALFTPCPDPNRSLPLFALLVFLLHVPAPDAVLSLQMPHSRRYRSSERSSRGSFHERYRSRKHKRRRSRSSSSERERRHRREGSYHVRSRRWVRGGAACRDPLLGLGAAQPAFGSALPCYVYGWEEKR